MYLIRHNIEIYSKCYESNTFKKNKKYACISRCVCIYDIRKKKGREVTVYLHMCCCCLVVWLFGCSVVIINRFGFPGPFDSLHGNTCFECSKFSLFIIFLDGDIMDYTSSFSSLYKDTHTAYKLTRHTGRYIRCRYNR